MLTRKFAGADLKSYAQAVYDDLLCFLGNIPTYAIAIESVNEAITTHERKQGQNTSTLGKPT